MKRSHYFPWMGLIPLALGGCYVYSVAIPVVGTLLFIDRGEGVTQMRQVAVDESCRRQGVGRKMVAYGEELMKGKGFSTIVLDARKVALDFYLALGYQVTSEELILSGIPHFKMKKEL